jgi:glycerol-3-phosphate dehydrogenase
VSARVLVNAAGPWVARVNDAVLGQPTDAPVRLVKGSHIVVPRLFEHDHAYTFQSGDGRVVFAIPYEQEFTLIGTTDLDFQGDPATAAITAEEIAYLCGVASDYMREPLTPDRVVWSFAGVRPLYDDGASKAKDATRDYVLALDAARGEAPRLTVYGGKITTYRRLAEAALAKLSPFLSAAPAWTRDVPLPGGDFAHDGVPALVAQARARWRFLDATQANRLVRAYGTRMDRVLADASGDAAIGGILYASEVRYLMRHEWAAQPDDVLWRRSKLGLHLGPADVAALGDFMRRQTARQAAE